MILLTFLIFILNIQIYSQISKDSDEYKLISSLDSLLFEVGFNECNLDQFENLLSDEFTFYHDESGITYSKKTFINDIKKYICLDNNKPIRKLNEKSVEIYLLRNNNKIYGVIQQGIHRFFIKHKDNSLEHTSTAHFTNLWLLENQNWKLKNSYSFNHKNENIISDDDSLLFKDKKLTEKWLKNKSIPALGIGYIKNGKIQEVNVFGELENDQPAQKNAIFNVASLTKPITALITLKLIDKGILKLDEAIYKYWLDPDLEKDTLYKKLTLRLLLSHQSGFGNWRFNNEDNKLKFDFLPGTKFQYSGEGYEYIRKVIENKTKRKLEDLANELIFKPLKMNNTYFYWSEKVDELRFAKWHTSKGEKYETYKNKRANAADDLLTTVKDYLIFLKYILEGAELSEKLYNEMISNQVQIKENKYFGLGWMVNENIGDGEFAINHGGDDKGVHTIAFILPKSKQALLIFTNSDNGTDLYIPLVLHYLNNLGQGIIDIETK